MSTAATRTNARVAAAIAAGDRLDRTYLIRAAGTDTGAREVDGVGVPYGEVVEHFFGRETFDPGSITEADTARVLWQHREPIGRVIETRDGPESFDLTARISQTPRGDEALTLVRDEVVTGWSIGFEPIEYRVEVDADGTETVHWTKVRAREFSLVTFPAYESAQTQNVRHAAGATREETHPMPDNPHGAAAAADAAAGAGDVLTRADLNPITERLSDLQREISLSAAGPADTLAAEAAQWRSMGEYVAAVARGDEQAVAFYSRAFAGNVSADLAAIEDHDGTGWLGTFIRFVTERRQTLNLFSRGNLPAAGMSVDYAALAGDTLQVGRQAAQGDDLPGPGKLTFVNDSDPVETFGGWTDLTRQVIERSNVPYLDTMWTALGLRYASATDKAVRDRLAAEVANLVAVGGSSVIDIDDPADPFDWIDVIIDAGEVYVDRGFDLSGLMVDKATFKSLARVAGTDGRPLMNVFGTGVNTVGKIEAKNGRGEIASLPVDILWKSAPGTRFFYDPVALKTLEAPGNPFRLQDDNIVNLTRAFSLYGYMAVTMPFPSAIVPVV